MAYDKIDQLYDALLKDGAVSKSRENFRGKMLAPGKEGYQNRLQLYNALKADGAIDSPTYEEFGRRLGLHAVKPQPVNGKSGVGSVGSMGSMGRENERKGAPHNESSANGGMTAAERQAMIGNVGGMMAQTDASLRRAKNKMEFARVNAGLQVPRTVIGERNGGVRVGQNAKVVSRKPQYDPSTGKVERSYVTENGSEFGTRAEADMEQNAIDEEARQPLGLNMNDQQVDAAQKPANSAVAALWKEAEAKYAVDRNKNAEEVYGGSPWLNGGREMHMVDAGLNSHKNEVSRLTRFDLQNMMDNAWGRVGKQMTASCYQQLKKQYPTATERQLQQSAADMARRLSDNAVYKYAVAKNTPKSTLEFFAKTAADTNLLRTISRGLARSEAGTSGDLDAYEKAMSNYGKNHRWAQIGGTVVGMMFDPTTYISGGVGSMAGKGALNIGGRLLFKNAAKGVGARMLGSTLAGRVAQGVAGGVGNLGAYEGIKEGENQWLHGGHVNAETGENEGYSAGEILKSTGRGALLGAATGTVSPILGNVADKWVKSTSSAMGKVGIRAGELATSTVAEGTIFATPEWIANSKMEDGNPNKRSAWDVWTDSMATMLGFKAQHMVKSAPRVIAGLCPVADPKTMEERNRNRMSFVERLRKQVDASPGDMAFTDEEREELQKYGYGDLATLFTRTPKQQPKPKAKPTTTDGKVMNFDIPEAEVEDLGKQWLKQHPEFDGYDAMERLMQDPNVSQSARAKAYYILTGRQLPMGTVTGYTTDKDENGNIFVKSVTANGEVVTNRRFADEASAKREQDKIMRQAELNSVDVGERYTEAKADNKVWDAAVEAVAPGADPETVKRNYQAAKEGDKDAIANYGQMVDAIDKFMEENKGMADAERPEAIRAAIKEETGVDVDAAIKKEPSNRTEPEKAAVQDYIERLFPEQGKENEQPMSDAEAEASAIYDSSRLLWGKAEQGDADAKADIDAISIRMKEALQECEDAFGTDAEMRMAEMEDNPWALANDPELTDDQRDAVLYYINAKAAMDGVQDASNDALDNKRREVAANVERHTHKDNGMVQPATLKVDDKPVYIVKGNVVMFPDGSGVDVRNSDQSIVICDAETGEYKFISPDQIFSVGDAIDPQAELDEAYASIQAEHEAILGSNANDESVPNSGESVQETPGNVQNEGENVQQPMTDEQLQQYAQGAFNEATQGNGGVTLPQEQVEEMQQHNRQMLEQDQQRKEEEANRKPTALERVPLNEETGEPMFEKADKETALDALNEVTGGNEANTTAIVNAQVEQAQKTLDALKKKQPTKKAPSLKGSPMAMVKAQQEADANYNAAMEQYNAQVAEAEETLGAWTRIYTLMNERKRAVRERQEAEQRERDKQLHDAAVAQVEEQKRVAAQKAAEQAEVGTHAVNPKIKAKWDGATKVEGNPNALTLADGSTIRGHYVLTEAGTATASHDINNAFEPTEGFPIDENGESVNDRDYKRDMDAQRIVRDIANNYDSRALQSPIIVSKDGVVLSGNNRTMSGDMAAQQGTDKAYIDHLREFGQMYGFTPEQIDGMKHPRVVFVPDEELPYDAATFARFNAEQQKKQSKPEQAVKLGKIVPDNVFNSIVGDISRFDRLSDYYADDKAVSSAISQLLGAGVINEMQLPEMRTGNSLSAAGKELIENTLIGKVFQTSPDAVRHIIGTPTLRQSVIMGLNEIAHNRTLAKSGYDLSRELGAAVDLVARAKRLHPDIFKDGMPVSPFGREQGLFDDEYGDSRVTDGIVLLLADVLNSGKPSDLRKILATYNSEADAPAGGQMDMFSGKVESKEELLNRLTDYFRNATPREQQAIVDAAVAERKQRAETSKQVGETTERSGEEPADIQGESNGGISEAHVGLNDDEANKLLSRMEGSTSEIPQIELNPTNWIEQFGETGMVSTPLGEVKMGENQIAKLFEKGRSEQFGMIKPTLEHPQVVIEVPSEASDGNTERASSLLFVKTFKGANGKKVYYFKSVTVKKDGLEVSVSSHYDRAKRVKEALKKGKLLYRFDGGAQTERHPADVSVTTSPDITQGNDNMVWKHADDVSDASDVAQGLYSSQGNVSDLATEGTDAPQTSMSNSDSKVINNQSELQEKGEKSSANNGVTPLSEQIATASADVNTEPTEAQKEAGNYKKGHVQVGTFDITIEQPEGSVRKGTDANGKKWESKMHNTYGYIRGTEGVDGDHIDVFLSNDIDGWNGRKVYVVDQYNPDGTFDEHKVMLGFNDMDEAKSDYLANYEKGWEDGRKIVVSATNLEDFEKWIDSSHRKTKPFAEYAGVKKETTDVGPMGMVGSMGKPASAIVKGTKWESTGLPEKYKAEREKKAWDKLRPVGEGIFGKVYDQFKGKVKEAFSFLTARGSGDLLGVFHRDGLGDVDVVWGDKGGGLDHIISKHVGEGKSFATVEEAASAIDDIIRTGKKEFENGDKVVLKKDGKIVTVRKNVRDKGKKIADKNWVLTAYDELSADGDVSAIAPVNQGQAARTTGKSRGKVTTKTSSSQGIRKKKVEPGQPVGEKGADTTEAVGHSAPGRVMVVKLQPFAVDMLEAIRTGNSDAAKKVLKDVGTAMRGLPDEVVQYVVAEQPGWAARMRKEGRNDMAEVTMKFVAKAKAELKRRNKPRLQKKATAEHDVETFAHEYGVNAEDVKKYAEGMATGNLALATQGIDEIRRAKRLEHHAENPFSSKLSDFVKAFGPIKKALYDKFGNVDELRQEYIRRAEEERNMMEAARKRAEEEEAKRKQHQEELSTLTEDEVDKRYADAIDKGDEQTAREMLDEAARRKGYGDTGSEYQGVGAWVAPSNPGYESDEARRADVEANAPDLNLEDMALGYNLQPDDYFEHPERYSQNTPHGLESTRAIQAALKALKRREKDVKVKVYRAVPTSVKEGSLRNGDWVTPSRKYAEMHGNSRLEGKYRIIEDEVPAKYLWWDGNDANEFGYDDGKAYKYKNVRNNRKLNDLVTHDDKGNVIPPSKRFNQRKADERYQRGEGGSVNERERVLRDAVVDVLKKNGMDVSMDAEEGQRVLDEANERVRMMGSRVKKRMAEIGAHYEGKELGTDEQAVTDVFGGKKDRASFNVETKNGAVTIEMQQGNENHAGTKHSIFRHYGTGIGYFTADEIKLIPEIIKNGERAQEGKNVIYTMTKDGVHYKVVTDIKGKKETFHDFYTNRKADTSKSSNTLLSARTDEASANSDAKVQKENVSSKGDEEKPRFFRTADGEAYGFTVGGKIYIDPRIANAETPIHEYAHLWASALRLSNPKEWRNVVRLMKDTPVWEEVKRRYPELGTEDEIADEVIATYSGHRGAERLREEARKAADGDGSVFDKASAISALGRVKEALNRFWKVVCDFLHIHYTSAEEVADRVMKDLLDGVDPRDKMGGGKSLHAADDRVRKQFIGETGAERADRIDAELEHVNAEFNERLSELAGNPNQKDKVLRLGHASQFLKDGGMADAEIVLEFDKLARKSREGYKHEHPFDMADIKDLPKAIASPIAVFDNTNGRNNGKVILTELKRDGRNFIVAVHAVRQNRKGGVVLEVNRIVTLFPKDARGVVNWFNLGRATNIDKEKALHFIEALPNHPGTTIKDEELISAANVVRNFENEKVSDGNVVVDKPREASPSLSTLILDGNTREEMTARVNELSERLHTPVRIIRTDEEVAALPSARQRRMKGSFNPMTGEVTIVVPNNANMADVENTFIHEVVGHDGLRVLFPDEEKLNNALDELYRVSNSSIQQTIDRMAQKMYDAEVDRLREKKRKEHEAKGEDANASYYADMAEAHAEASKKREQFKRDATEEYGADLAGRIGESGFEKMSAEELTFWGKLKAMLQKALQKLLAGLKIPGKRKWNDKDWAFVLHEAYKRKKNGGRPTVFDAADTEVMRRKTGFGEMKFSDGKVEQKPKVATTITDMKQRVTELFEKAMTGEFVGKPASIGRLSADGKAYLEKLSGLKFKEFVDFVLNPSDLNHIRSDHYGENEKDKGNNVPLTDEDIQNMVDVLNQPDGILYGVDKKDGRKLFFFLKDAGNGLYNLTEVCSTKKGNLTAKSFFKSKKKGISQRVMEIKDSLLPTSVTYSGEFLSSDAKIPTLFEINESSSKNVADEGIMFRDGDMGLDETITQMKIAASQANADNWQSKQEAMKAIGGNLNKLRQAMARQREYDLSTVKSITDLAKVLLDNGLLDDLSKYETKRILSAVNNAHGKQDTSNQVAKVMDIMVDNQLRMGANMLGRLLSTRGSRVDARGIEVQGQLDPDGQTIAQVVRKATSLPKADIEERIAEALNRMGSDDQAVADEASLEYNGLLLAHQFAEDITDSKAEEKALRDSLKQAKEDLDAGMMDKNAYSEYVAATNDAIRQNKIERAEAYRSIVEQVGGVLGESVERAKQWREEEKQRVEAIHHNANSDMVGRPTDEHHKESKVQKIANNSLVRFALAPLGTFDQMLRMFGKKSVNGEGYLWNRYMRGWVDATEREYKGYQNALQTLDDKVSEVFGKKMKWGDLFAIERKLPKATVTFWDGGEKKDHELTQGNLLYIYMVDKMADGRMKLRRMGITEEDVENIKDFVDPRFLELADWMQEEFLVEKRNEYNEVHKRMFGASMAAIENYFPLKILANARMEDVDVADDTTDTALPATSTGSIIKRRRNNLALDVMGADAFSVILDHVQQMERWAAFAEFNRDLNTLLSYKHFRNQVMNMSSVYGGGKTLWNNFRNVCSMAAGAYRPPIATLDKVAVNIAKGVTAAKVSFRVFTALKQFLSMPAYLPDSNPVYLAANIANPIVAWKWSMENLPLFEKRWKSRMAGDPRLMKSEMDWKMWQNHVVEIASRIGMSPNAFVDALTVAIGSHAMYQTKKQKYLRYGYDEEVAEKRAKQDATILFNQTQQSSESAFLSTMQVDRSWLSVLFTIFRNSSMSYTRKLYDALRNIKHRFEPGYKELSEEFMAKQMRRDGIDPDKADSNAKSEYRRSLLHDMVTVGVFGFILQMAWNLGAYLPYLIAGDDKDQKDDMWDDAFKHSFFGSIEGLTGGDVISAVGNDWIHGKGLNLNTASKEMPISSDIQSIVSKWNKDKVAAMNDVVNLLVQSGVGVNPQSLTDAVVAIMDYCGGDAETSRECALLIARILNCPQSQTDKIYFDELNATAAEASKMTPAEIAERYAEYKIHRGAPLTGWAYSEEARDSVKTAQQNRVLTQAKEKMSNRMETETTKKLLSTYDEVSKQQTELSKLKQTDRAAYRDGMKQLRQKYNMREHGRMKQYKHDMKQLTDKYLRSKSAEERDSLVRVMTTTRDKMLDDIGRMEQQ